MDWQSKNITLDAKLAEKRLGSMDGESICQGTAAGGANYVGPAVAQPIQNLFNSGSHSVYGLLMNKCAKSSALFATLSEPPYENNAEYAYGYINFVMQANPTPEDFQNWDDTWTSTAFKSCVHVNEASQYKWFDYLVHLNMKQPLPMRKTNQEIARKWSHYNHPAITQKTMDMYENPPVGIIFPVNYPALLFAGGPAHPQAGVPHAQAGEFNMTAFVKSVDPRWQQLILSKSVHVPVICGPN